MPIPTPNKGEKEDAFISRCMGNPVMNKEFPDQKQRAGVCYSQWRKPKQMALKFNYQVPILERGLVDDAFIIKGTAISATTTSSHHQFLEEELKPAAETLAGVPLLKNHTNEVESIMGRVLKGEWLSTEKRIEFNAHVIDKDMQKLISDGRLNSVSIGADVDDLEETDDGLFIPRGIKFRELSLVAVGADEGARFSVALKQAYDTKLKSLNINRKGEVKMSKDEEEEIEEPEDKEEKPEDKPEEKGITKEEAKTMIDEAVDKAVKAVKEADKDEPEDKPEDIPEDKPEKKPKKKEEPEEPEEESEEEPAEEKGNSFVQSHGSLRGGSFTLVRG